MIWDARSRLSHVHPYPRGPNTHLPPALISWCPVAGTRVSRPSDDSTCPLEWHHISTSGFSFRGDRSRAVTCMSAEWDHGLALYSCGLIIPRCFVADKNVWLLVTPSFNAFLFYWFANNVVSNLSPNIYQLQLLGREHKQSTLHVTPKRILSGHMTEGDSGNSNYVLTDVRELPFLARVYIVGKSVVWPGTRRSGHLQSSPLRQRELKRFLFSVWCTRSLLLQ